MKFKELPADLWERIVLRHKSGEGYRKNYSRIEGPDENRGLHLFQVLAAQPIWTISVVDYGLRSFFTSKFYTRHSIITERTKFPWNSLKIKHKNVYTRIHPFCHDTENWCILFPPTISHVSLTWLEFIFGQFYQMMWWNAYISIHISSHSCHCMLEHQPSPSL